MSVVHNLRKALKEVRHNITKLINASKKTIPEQGNGLHVSPFDALSGQSFPLKAGLGFVHDLTYVCTPDSQVLEQDPLVCHSVQAP